MLSTRSIAARTGFRVGRIDANEKKPSVKIADVSKISCSAQSGTEPNKCDRIPDGLFSSFNVLPALTAKYVAGITPKNVPNMKGFNDTSSKGDDKLINQFGRKGVIRKKRISVRGQ